MTARQTARAMRTLATRYPREVTLSWTRAEFNAKLAEIGTELFGAQR